MKQRKKHFRKRRLTPYIILAVTIVFLGTLSFIFLKDTIVIPVGSSTPNAKQAGSSQEERAVQQALAKPAPTQIQQQNGVVSVDKLIWDVPYISQEEKFPSGCEMVSSAMVLQYYGYSVTAEELIDVYLDKEDFYWEDDILYGADPYKAFAGDPRDSWSCGCYAPVVEKTLNRVLSGKQKAVDTTGTSLKDLEKHIDTQDPGLVWASINMEPTCPGNEWIAVDSGRTVRWISPEHCMVLVGYDEDKYYFNDPYESNGLVSYSKSLVEKRFQELGYQSVVIQSNI